MGLDGARVVERLSGVKEKIKDSLEDNEDKFSRAYLRGFRDGIEIAERYIKEEETK